MLLVGASGAVKPKSHLARHDTFDVSSRAVRQARHSQNALAQHVKRVMSRCDVTSQMEVGLKSLLGNGIKYRDTILCLPVQVGPFISRGDYLPGR